MSMFDHLDVSLAILQYLDSRDLALLSMACERTRVLVTMELRRRVCHVFASHLPRSRIHSFLNLLENNASVVSGSSALAVVCWNTKRDFRLWPSTRDLDVYVPLKCTRPFLDFFLSLGYAIDGKENRKRSAYQPINGVMSVTTLVLLPASIPLAPLKVDIVESTRLTAVWPLAHFWGTVVNNFVSGRTVVSAYPSDTLNGACVVNPDAVVHRAILAKYRARGFKVVDEWRNMKYVTYMHPHLTVLTPPTVTISTTSVSIGTA